MTTLRFLRLGSAAAASILLAAACGSGSFDAPVEGSAGPEGAKASAAVVVGLAVHGSGTSLKAACGSEKEFTRVRPGQPLLARMTVEPAPAAGSRMKLKVKFCREGTWQLVGEERPEADGAGPIETLLRLPAPGDYVVRAYYYEGSSRTRSEKAYVSLG